MIALASAGSAGEVCARTAAGQTPSAHASAMDKSAKAGRERTVRGSMVNYARIISHQERSLSDRETLDFVMVRSGNEGFLTKLDAAAVEQPETVFQGSRS